MPKRLILLTDKVVPPPTLIARGLEALPVIIRAQGEPRTTILTCYLQRIRWKRASSSLDRARAMGSEATHAKLTLRCAG